MNNASTPDGRGQDRPNEAGPFFPAEGSFNPVVPLSELGHAPARLPTVDAADVGRPAEAAWAREEYRALPAGRKEEEETTLVPTRARAARRPWAVTAAVIALSIAAGLASGAYLTWSSQRAPEAQTSATVAAEAPGPPPAPVAEQGEADKNVEKVDEPARAEKPREVVKPSEVAKAEQSAEVAHAPKQEPPVRTADAPRAERPARAVAEPNEITPAPTPARTQSAPPARPRLTTAEKQPPAPAERTLPVSSPPPSAKSKKVIQWP
jgi:hypothetical protein